MALGIVRQTTANPLDISQAVRAELPAIERSLPAGIDIEIAYDQATFIEESIANVYWTLGQAGVLVALIIFVFLRSLRATVIPVVTIPVSLVGAGGAAVALRLFDQHADPAGAGAGDRLAGRRRDRDAGERLSPH